MPLENCPLAAARRPTPGHPHDITVPSGASPSPYCTVIPKATHGHPHAPAPRPLASPQTTVRLQNLTARTLNAVLADSLGGAMTIQRLSKVSTSEELLNTGWRSWALAYAQFYQRMADQMMTLIIFATLLVLSFLPILRLQTSILFNRQFADILNRKIHKQEVLDDLYTPGMFYQVEADDDPSKDRAKKSPMLAMLRAKVPGAPGVLGAFSKAKGGLKLPGLGTPKADSGTSSTKPSDELDTVSV